MKRILSIILCFVLVFSLLGICPIMVNAATEKKLNAYNYAALNKYNSSSSFWVSNIAYPQAVTAQYMQSLESMKSIGFSDKTNIPYVAFNVEAPADGVYNISPNYYVGGSGSLNNYQLVVSVNDRDIYQAESVNSFKAYKHTLEVSLNKGINIIRLIPFTAENSSLFKSGKVYVNFYALYVDSTLSGVSPQNNLTLYPVYTSEYINDYGNLNTNEGYLATVYIDSAAKAGITYEAMEVTDLFEMPYFSYTITAPKSGYYDVTIEVYCGLLGEQGYLTVFVDDVKTTWGFIDTKAWFTSANISVFIPEGTHTFTLTSALGLQSQYYRDWCDFRTIKFGGGITLNNEQFFPVKERDNVINADGMYMHNYKSESGMAFPEENTIPFDKNCTDTFVNDFAYLALGLRAPTEGNYSISVNAGLNNVVGSSKELYTIANINGYDYKIPLENSTEHSTIVLNDVFLKKGINYAYFYSSVSELDVDISTVYSSIVLPSKVEGISMRLYRSGDSNGDGYISITDLLRAKKYMADNSVPCENKAADLTDNIGDVTADDIVLFKKLLLNIKDPALPDTNMLYCDFLESPLVQAVTTSYEGADNPCVDFSNELLVYDASKLNENFGNVVYLNPQVKYQTVYGFGGSLTDSSAYNLNKSMSSQNRKNVMNALFDDETGIGLNILRQPCGVNDFAVDWYTYNDLDEGETDYDLNNFSIERDKDYIIPAVKEAMSINPEIDVISAVWSPPLWMKTKYSWITTPENMDYSVPATETNTAMLKKDCYDVFARYCAKYIKAYEELGIPIKSFVAQNELTGRHGIPQTYYYPEDYSELINDYIAPTFASQGIDTELWSWDFNYFEWDIINFTNGMLENASGIAMHTYAGEIDVVKRIHERFPQLGIYVTESSVVRTKGAVATGMNEINTLFRYGASSIVRWCLVLNEYNGPSDTRNPHLHGSYGTAAAAPITYFSDKKTLSYSTDYYLLGHFSKYIDRGAHLIESTDISIRNKKISNTAFLNPDGTLVLEFSNSTPDNQVFKFVVGDKVFEYTLKMKSIATIKLQYE